MSQKTAVVIGGGIAGLASAALLAKAGMKVTFMPALASRAAEASPAIPPPMTTAVFWVT